MVQVAESAERRFLVQKVRTSNPNLLNQMTYTIDTTKPDAWY